MASLFQAIRPLVLASSSPRRQCFFHEQGLACRIMAPAAPEPDIAPGEAPERYAARIAAFKADQVLAMLADEPERPVIIAADTIVVLNEPDGPEILGKPANPPHALAMLKRLAGREHTVITACCVLPAQDPPCVFFERSKVFFAPWPEEVLRAYVKTGEPLDKAGAYGIQAQGAFLVERIEGSWSNVVGLPMSGLTAVLMNMGAIRPV